MRMNINVRRQLTFPQTDAWQAVHSKKCTSRFMLRVATWCVGSSCITAMPQVDLPHPLSFSWRCLSLPKALLTATAKKIASSWPVYSVSVPTAVISGDRRGQEGTGWGRQIANRITNRNTRNTANTQLAAWFVFAKKKFVILYYTSLLKMSQH